MATFVTKDRKNGTTAYMAQIVRRNPAYQESKTFDKLKISQTWANKREKEIDADIAAGRTPQKRSAKRATLADAIRLYLDESLKEIGKPKRRY